MDVRTYSFTQKTINNNGTNYASSMNMFKNRINKHLIHRLCMLWTLNKAVVSLSTFIWSYCYLWNLYSLLLKCNFLFCHCGSSFKIQFLKTIDSGRKWQMCCIRSGVVGWGVGLGVEYPLTLWQLGSGPAQWVCLIRWLASARINLSGPCHMHGRLAVWGTWKTGQLVEPVHLLSGQGNSRFSLEPVYSWYLSLLWEIS